MNGAGIYMGCLSRSAVLLNLATEYTELNDKIFRALLLGGAVADGLLISLIKPDHGFPRRPRRASADRFAVQYRDRDDFPGGTGYPDFIGFP